MQYPFLADRTAVSSSVNPELAKQVEIGVHVADESLPRRWVDGAIIEQYILAELARKLMVLMVVHLALVCVKLGRSNLPILRIPLPIQLQRWPCLE